MRQLDAIVFARARVRMTIIIIRIQETSTTFHANEITAAVAAIACCAICRYSICRIFAFMRLCAATGRAEREREREREALCEQRKRKNRNPSAHDLWCTYLRTRKRIPDAMCDTAQDGGITYRTRRENTILIFGQAIWINRFYWLCKYGDDTASKLSAWQRRTSSFVVRTYITFAWVNVSAISQWQ